MARKALGASMDLSDGPDDIAKAIPVFRSLPPLLQLAVVLVLVTGAAVVVVWKTLNYLHNERFSDLETKIGMKDATIEQRNALIEDLKMRQENQKVAVQRSIARLEGEDSNGRLVAEIAALRGQLNDAQNPILGITPFMFVANPKNSATSLVQVGFEVRNLGGATALGGWQASVRMLTRSIGITEGFFYRGQRPSSNSALRGSNLAIDEETIDKGGKRTGWIQFDVAGDPKIDGSPLEIRQVYASFRDYTGKRYSPSMPPDEPLPSRAVLLDAPKRS